MSSQGISETVVMESSQIASADEMPQNTQLPSGFAEFCDSERRDRKSAKAELGRLALRIASGENVAADEIDTIVSDCDASPGKLRKLVDEATEVLRLVALIEVEAADAADLDAFQNTAAGEIRTLWAIVAALRTYIAFVLCRFYQLRCDIGARTAKTAKISLAAAEAAKALSDIDVSVYGLDQPKRTIGVVRDVGFTPRNIGWVDIQTANLISRKKAEFLKLSAAGKLPPVQVIEPPACMFEAAPVKREVVEPTDETAAEVVETSDEPAQTAAEVAPAAEARSDKRTRKLGIAPGDLADESSNE